MNEAHLRSCSSAVLEMISVVHDTEKFQRKLRILKDSLEECCILLKKSPTVTKHEILKEFLFYPLFRIGFHFQSELPNFDGKKEDILLYKNGFAVVIKLKYNSGADKDLEQIFDRGYYDHFNGTLYPQGVANYILMVLDFSPELKISICYLRKQDIVYHGVALNEQRQKLAKSKIQNLLKAALTV